MPSRIGHGRGADERAKSNLVRFFVERLLSRLVPPLSTLAGVMLALECEPQPDAPVILDDPSGLF